MIPRRRFRRSYPGYVADTPLNRASAGHKAPLGFHDELVNWPIAKTAQLQLDDGYPHVRNVHKERKDHCYHRKFRLTLY